MVTKVTVRGDEGVMLHVAFLERFTTRGKLRLFVPFIKHSSGIGKLNGFGVLYENYVLEHDRNYNAITLSKDDFPLATFSQDKRGKFGCTRELGRDIWRVLQKMGFEAWGADLIDYNGEAIVA